MRTLMAVAIAVTFLVSPVRGITCDGTCSGHGACDGSTGKCKCFAGYIGTSCKQMSCPEGVAWADYASATDVAHDMAECSNMGLCDRITGVCKCSPGFEGVACERMSCPTCTNGRCISMREAAEIQDNTNFFVATTYKLWDAEKIYGCQCDNGFSGFDCSQRECPKGDDPMTTGQVAEIQQLVCICDGCSGSFALTFRRRTTVNLLPGDLPATLESALEKLDTISGVTVNIIGGGTTLCSAAGTTTQITFTNNPGDVPTLLIQDRLTGGAVTPSLTITTPTPGTREEAYCSNRGLCDFSSGICVCNPGFSGSNGAGGVGTRGDCGFGTATACPMSNGYVCNNRGVCDSTGIAPTFRCTCDQGFSGYDCSLRTCPQGAAWFDGATAPDTAHAMAPCSNRGTCDTRTGLCLCSAIFTGSACDVLKCPGASTPCNGHGTCKTMQQLALASAKNGDLLGVTYGQTLNVASTWDYNKIQGCDCTKNYYLGPYSGALGEFRDYDCSARFCPLGADPYEVGKVNEKQTLACRAENGWFSLTFRQYTTPRIAFDATAATLKTALESLPTIDSVIVTFAGGAIKPCGDTAAIGTFVTSTCLSQEDTTTVHFASLTLLHL